MKVHVRQIPTTERFVYAFDVSGHASAEDLEDMARPMRAALDAGEEIALLVRLEPHPDDALGALADASATRLCLGSLEGVRRYAVVGDPPDAEALLAGLNLVVPVEARTCVREAEDRAWRHVGARAVADAAA